MKLYKVTAEDVDAIFENATEQGEVILALYEMVVPDFDAVEEMGGHPACSRKLWEYVCRKFFEFDAIHHPGVMAGGAWLNWGFSCDENLSGWMVRPPSGTKYKQGVLMAHHAN